VLVAVFDMSGNLVDKCYHYHKLDIADIVALLVADHYYYNVLEAETGYNNVVGQYLDIGFDIVFD
jgi:hypothetical protein